LERSVKILALDPGTTQSGWCIYDTKEKAVVHFGLAENQNVINYINDGTYDEVAIEMIASYGMAVGAEVFETCVWIGRFVQCCANLNVRHKSVYRKDCKMFLCGTTKAKDANIRQAIIDKFGGIQSTKPGGKLHGIKSHVWPALAVALTYESKQ
jgi:hypothetical protein